MRTVFLIARDNIRALMHRRLLLAIMLVMLILTVILSFTQSQISRIDIANAPPSAAVVAEPGPRAPPSEPETFQEALERAQPPPEADPTEEMREALQIASSQALAQFFGFVSFGGMVVALFIGATAVSGDVRSGAITMILARPVRRWQFLIGKFGGAIAVLLGYSILASVAMVIFTEVNGLDVIPAARFAPWLMFCENLIYASFALVLSMVMPPILAGILPVFVSGDLFVFFPSSNPVYYLHFLFPSHAPYSAMNQIMSGTIVGWDEVAILTVYALDLVAIFVLLAMWRFRSKAVV